MPWQLLTKSDCVGQFCSIITMLHIDTLSLGVAARYGMCTRLLTAIILSLEVICTVMNSERACWSLSWTSMTYTCHSSCSSESEETDEFHSHGWDCSKRHASKVFEIEILQKLVCQFWLTKGSQSGSDLMNHGMVQWYWQCGVDDDGHGLMWIIWIWDYAWNLRLPGCSSVDIIILFLLSEMKVSKYMGCLCWSQAWCISNINTSSCIRIYHCLLYIVRLTCWAQIRFLGWFQTRASRFGTKFLTNCRTAIILASDRNWSLTLPRSMTERVGVNGDERLTQCTSICESCLHCVDCSDFKGEHLKVFWSH